MKANRQLSLCVRFLARSVPVPLIVASLLWLAPHAVGQVTFQRIKSFGSPHLNGYDEWAGVIQGADGALYGTTAGGQPYGAGTVFRLNPDGTGGAVLKTFNGLDGNGPRAGLIQADDGKLYGTTYYGGAGYLGLDGFGNVFRLNSDGSGFEVIKGFNSTDGAHPHSSLMQGNDGMLYGTTYAGGSSGLGTVFKIHLDGTGYAVIANFDGAAGANPYAGLIQGADGALYGTTFHGGMSELGTLFKLNTDGSSFTVLKHFDGPGGANPYGGVVQRGAGALYGTTFNGGSYAHGAVFKLNPDGSGFTVLKHFDNAEGAYPRAGLLLATDGALYGTTYAGGNGSVGVLFKIGHDGTGYAALKSFDYTTGLQPYAGVVEGTDGKLYGTTTYAGAIGDGIGYGSVFKVDVDGSGMSVLRVF